MPKPFDLSRFLCTAVTFLVKVKKITILSMGSSFRRSSNLEAIAQAIDLPEDLKRKRDNWLYAC
jgi:hypothetical protein